MAFASEYPEKGVEVIKLSELNGENWKDMRNRFGDHRMTDFALTEPFQLFTPESANVLREIADKAYFGPHKYSTERTSACVRGCPELVNIMGEKERRTELERIVSAFTGQNMKMVPITYEHSHTNVQREPQDKPVDNWHQDSMPYVMVTILTEHSKDPGGSLLVKKEGEFGKEYRCKLKTPGEAVFMQGMVPALFAFENNQAVCLIRCFKSLKAYFTVPSACDEDWFPEVHLPAYSPHICLIRLAHLALRAAKRDG